MIVKTIIKLNEIQHQCIIEFATEEVKLKKTLLLIVMMLSTFTLASCFKTNNYDVTFLVNNETYEVISFKANEALVLPTDPEVSNFIFQGWYFDPLFTDPFNEFEAYYVTYNLTLYAKMRELDPDATYYEISFYDQGTLIEKASVKENETIPSNVNTAKDGYYFAGWYKDSALTTPYNSQTPVSSEFSLYGKWNEQPGEFLAYYSGIEGLTGTSLKTKLTSIITAGYKSIGYSSTSFVLDESDKVLPSANTLWLIYNSGSVNAVWDSGNTWNKEHVWPRSKLPNSTAESDIHNLRASNPLVNSTRGNLPFRDSSGTYRKVGDGWYPGDEHIGDVARIVLYMHIRWNIAITSSSIGDLSMFLEWHLEDPVSDFERNRNEVIYREQKNRNPFIDHPELVSMVFSNQNVSQHNSDIITLNLPHKASFVFFKEQNSI